MGARRMAGRMQTGWAGVALFGVFAAVLAFGGTKNAAAQATGSVYSYQSPRVIDNTNKGDAFNCYDRPRQLQDFTWGSKPYLLVDSGIDVLIYDPATGTQLTKGGFGLGYGCTPSGSITPASITAQALVSIRALDFVTGISLCDECRYGVVGSSDGARVFDLGTPSPSATPKVVQAWSYANTTATGGTYKIGSTQYLLFKGGFGSKFFRDCSGGAFGVYSIPATNFNGTPTKVGCADPSFQPDWGMEITTAKGPFYIYHDSVKHEVNIVSLTAQIGQVPGVPGPPILATGLPGSDLDPISVDLRHMNDASPYGYLLITNNTITPAATLYKMIPTDSSTIQLQTVQTFSAGKWNSGAVHYPYVFLMEHGDALGATKAFYDLSSGQPVEQDPTYWNGATSDFNQGAAGGGNPVDELDAVFTTDGQWMYWARYYQLERFKFTPKNPAAALTVTPAEVFWSDTVTLDGSASADAQEYAAWIDDDPTGLSTSAAVVAGTQVLTSGDAGWKTGPPPMSTLTWKIPDSATGPYYAHVAVQDVPNGYPYDPAGHPEMLQTVQVNFNTQPQASFAAPASALINDTVTITNTSQGNPTAYHWTVTDPSGAPTTYTTRDISVTFDQPGDWTVDLTADYKADASYSSRATQATVTVKSAIASFTISPNPATTAQDIYLDASASQPSDQLSWAWSVSDATAEVWTSTAETPTIPKGGASKGGLDAGTYTVKLTVTNNTTQEADIATQSLVVTDPPLQSLTISPTNPDRGQFVQFMVNGLYLNSNSVVNWNFGGSSCNPSTEPQQTTCNGLTWGGFLTCSQAQYHYSTAGSYQVTVSGTDGNGVPFSVNGQVTVQPNGQCSGTTCTYSLSVNPSQFAASGGSGTVTVTTSAGCSWTISDNATWLNLSPTSGTGAKTLTATAAANTGAFRTATITLKDGSGNVKATASMSQAPASGSSSVDFTYSPSNPKVGETVQFTVTAGSGTPQSWNFGQANCNGDSPSISNCSLLGSFCSAPTWDFSKAGTVNVTLTTDFGSVTKAITIADGQCSGGGGGGSTCTPTLTPGQTSFGSDGGSSSVAVSIDGSCTWTASSDRSWIQITAPTSSVVGNGTVSFTVAKNDTTGDRSGHVTVLGTSVTITQSAAPAGGGGAGGTLNAQSLVPAAANIAGKNGTDWKTELCVFNPNTSPAQFEVKLLDSFTNPNGGTVVVSSQAVDPLGTWCDDDLLAATSGQIKGALTVELKNKLPLGLAVTSRTYTPDPNTGTGTYGQFVPALRLEGTPVHQLVLTGLHSWGDIKAGEGYRTNLGIVNQSDQTTPRIVIKVYDDAGNLVGTYRSVEGNLYTALGPHGFIQFDDPIIDLLDQPVPGGLHDFSIVISFTNTSGDPLTAEVTAYATVVDNATGDATFIPAVAIP